MDQCSRFESCSHPSSPDDFYYDYYYYYDYYDCSLVGDCVNHSVGGDHDEKDYVGSNESYDFGDVVDVVVGMGGMMMTEMWMLYHVVVVADSDVNDEIDVGDDDLDGMTMKKMKMMTSSSSFHDSMNKLNDFHSFVDDHVVVVVDEMTNNGYYYYYYYESDDDDDGDLDDSVMKWMAIVVVVVVGVVDIDDDDDYTAADCYHIDAVVYHQCSAVEWVVRLLVLVVVVVHIPVVVVVVDFDCDVDDDVV